MAKQVSFKYQAGHCLECDIVIDNNQIFCSKHRQPKPINTPRTANKNKPGKKIRQVAEKITKITEMDEGQVGFVEEYALFEDKGLLFILGSVSISNRRDRYKTVKIRFWKKYYEIDRNTIDLMDIFIGVPDMEGKFTFFNAKLVQDFH